MITRNGRSFNCNSCKIPVVILLFLFGSRLAYSQNKMSFLTDSKYETEWWFQLIKKHNIDPYQFTYGGNIMPVPGVANGYTALELGKSAFLSDSTLTIKDPLFIIKENEEKYNIITAKSAIHEFGSGQIIWEDGRIEEYENKSAELKPSQSYSFVELQMDLRTKRVLVKNISGKVHN